MKEVCQTTKITRITTRTKTITRTKIIRVIITKRTKTEITKNYFRLSQFNRKGPVIGPFLLNYYISIQRFKEIIKKSKVFA